MRVVIVSHGQPGDPVPQEEAIEDLAARVATENPGCPVKGATLAMPGALEAAADNDSLIYPMFMAEGWFTGRQLPKKLAEIGAPDARVMRPFGVNPNLPDLMIAKAHQAAQAQGWLPPETTLLLTAHGSQRSQASYEITTQIAAQVAPHFARVVTGFVEQEPFIRDSAENLTRAVHLPMFALRADHVTDDLPEALAQAGFTGLSLDPIGLMPEIPALIAATIREYISNLK